MSMHLLVLAWLMPTEEDVFLEGLMTVGLEAESLISQVALREASQKKKENRVLEGQLARSDFLI